MGWWGTPEQVFTGRYKDSPRDKQKALDERYALNPERFARTRPVVRMPPATVAINLISPGDEGCILNDRVNFPTLTAAGYVK